MMAGRAEPGARRPRRLRWTCSASTTTTAANGRSAPSSGSRWHLRDPRRLPLAALLDEAWQRYRGRWSSPRPATSASAAPPGSTRSASEVRRARADGVPVQGLCLYPLVDRPDWNEPQRWHRSALWHVDAGPGAVPALARTVDRPLLAALRQWQAAHAGTAAPPAGTLLVLADRPWDPPSHPLAQLLRRLAGRWRIAYLEPPRPASGASRLDVIGHGPDLDVLVPWLAPGEGPDPASALRRLLRDRWPAFRPRRCWSGRTAPPRAGWPGARRTGRVIDAAAVDASEVGVDLAAFEDGPCGWEAEEAGRLTIGIDRPRIGVAGGLDGRIDLALLDQGRLSARTGTSWSPRRRPKAPMAVWAHDPTCTGSARCPSDCCRR